MCGTRRIGEMKQDKKKKNNASRGEAELYDYGIARFPYHD